MAAAAREAEFVLLVPPAQHMRAVTRRCSLTWLPALP